MLSEAKKAKKRAYYHANKEKLAALNRIYTQKRKKRRAEYDHARYVANKAKYSDYHKARYQAKGRKAALMKKYGLTMEEYEDMWRLQNGCCEICRTEIPFGGWRTHIDHCHVTGKVRGILCQKCNLWVGHCDRLGEIGIEAGLAYLRGTP